LTEDLHVGQRLCNSETHVGNELTKACHSDS